MALTIPEVCAGLNKPAKDKVGFSDYVEFVDRYTTRDDLAFTGEECYYLRCGLIHKGDTSGHSKFPTSHVMFTTPESGSSFHGPTLIHGGHDVSCRTANAVTFCAVMDAAARAWIADNIRNEPAIEKSESLLSRRPGGLFPFVIGLPVVASGAPIPQSKRILQWPAGTKTQSPTAATK